MRAPVQPQPYAVLLHTLPGGSAHVDLLISPGAELALMTWRLPRWLPSEPGEELDDLPAERLPDHRRVYLEHEGPISGNRGVVRRLERGQAHIGEASLQLVRATLTSESGQRRLLVLMRGGTPTQWSAWVARG